MRRILCERFCQAERVRRHCQAIRLRASQRSFRTLAAWRLGATGQPARSMGNALASIHE